jgi:hypothetical protein
VFSPIFDPLNPGVNIYILCNGHIFLNFFFLQNPFKIQLIVVKCT